MNSQQPSGYIFPIKTKKNLKAALTYLPSKKSSIETTPNQQQDKISDKLPMLSQKTPDTVSIPIRTFTPQSNCMFTRKNLIQAAAQHVNISTTSNVASQIDHLKKVTKLKSVLSSASFARQSQYKSSTTNANNMSTALTSMTKMGQHGLRRKIGGNGHTGNQN